LKVDENKVSGMIQSVHNTIKLDDPEGKVLDTYEHENGLKMENKTVPFGKILIIYESRPDVTIEAAIVAFKAGNKILLKGGKEAKETNKYLVFLWEKALLQH
jgi:glutamate-5-semialdehyde dehydrogenase